MLLLLNRQRWKPSVNNPFYRESFKVYWEKENALSSVFGIVDMALFPCDLDHCPKVVDRKTWYSNQSHNTEKIKLL